MASGSGTVPRLAPISSLARQVEFLGTLGKVLPWGLVQRPQWTVVDVVIQDEYTHDVVLGAQAEPTSPPDLPDPRALVLDCT